MNQNDPTAVASSSSDFAVLERVDVRQLWPSESRNFTPWLAEDETLRRLGEELGIQLEIECTEAAVGRFSADILCRDVDTDEWVVVENQFSSTDHDHLGKLLTYAAGLDARTIVWLAENFKEEHRAAIDWLNKFTGEEVNFFGIQIEAWRIDNSRPAPRFNLVCKPNNWSKSLNKAAKSTGLTDKRSFQLEYWTQFNQFLYSKSTVLKPLTPRPKSGMSLPIGKANFRLRYSMNTNEGRIAVVFAIKGINNKENFYKLQEDQHAIETEFGEPLEWRELPDKQESQVLLALETDPLNKELWPTQHEWLFEKLEALQRCFSKRIRDL